MQTLFSCLPHTPLQIQITGNANQHNGDNAHQRRGSSSGSVILGGDDVLDLRGTGDRGHGDAESAKGNGTGQKGAGQICFPVNGIAHGIDHKHNHKQGNAAVSHQQAGQHNSQYSKLGADQGYQLVGQ